MGKRRFTRNACVTRFPTMSKMSKELKAGDKITCVIEQRLPNCLIVRFQNGKAGSENNTSVFRGVLIDEESAATKRYLYVML